MNLYLSRLHEGDVEEVNQVFVAAISHAFAEDGIDDPAGIKEDVEAQMDCIRQDLASNGSEVYYLIARLEEKIVGTIAYGPANSRIREHVQMDLEEIPEIKSVYILPEFQGHGVGSLLFNGMLLTLAHHQVSQFCLDGGFKKSQGFWRRKLGDPTVILHDYWGEGLDHLIWVRNLQDVPIRYLV